MKSKEIQKYIRLSDEVKKAIEDKKGVVALESTIITHGMPYPDNVKMALDVEKIIREEGSIPATIAIIDGIIRVGLSESEIDDLGKRKDVYKASRRDLAPIIAKELCGGTTVASTMIISEMAGIKIFATGGIGGVHRDGHNTMDVSADLEELSKTNVAVVCAGAKAILDIERTLEYLETKGVSILGNKTNDFPAFYTRKSGFQLDYRVDSIEEFKKILNTKDDLNLSGGVLIANPIPKEFEMDQEFVNEVIEAAVLEAERNSIKGKEITPFLLSKVKENSEGESLKANIELVYNNARLAGKIANIL